MEGIYLFQMDPATGALTQRELFPNDSNPSWIALDRSEPFVFGQRDLELPGR